MKQQPKLSYSRRHSSPSDGMRVYYSNVGVEETQALIVRIVRSGRGCVAYARRYFEGQIVCVEKR